MAPICCGVPDHSVCLAPSYLRRMDLRKRLSHGRAVNRLMHVSTRVVAARFGTMGNFAALSPLRPSFPKSRRSTLCAEIRTPRNNHNYHIGLFRLPHTRNPYCEPGAPRGLFPISGRNLPLSSPPAFSANSSKTSCTETSASCPDRHSDALFARRARLRGSRRE